MLEATWIIVFSVLFSIRRRGGGVGGGVLFIILLLFLVGRRRKKLSEIDIVESWSSFDKAMQARNDTSELDQANLFEQEDENEMPKMIDL